MAHKIKMVGEKIEVLTDGWPGKPALAKIKALPGRKWDGDRKIWWLPASPDGIAAAVALAAELCYVVGDDLLKQASDQAKQDASVFAVQDAFIDKDKKAWKFQREGSKALARNSRYILGDDMGLGKTRQTLMALPPAKECSGLVISPASIKGVWEAEIKKWRPEFKVTVISGRGNFRYPKTGEIIIINFDILPKVDELEKMQIPADLIVAVDEAHNCKNYKALRTKRVTKIIEGADQAWLLTGTALQNRPGELWTILNVGGLVEKAGLTFGRFCGLFGAKKGQYGMVWGAPRPEMAEILKRVMLRREKGEVLQDLPEKVYSKVPVDIF